MKKKRSPFVLLLPIFMLLLMVATVSAGSIGPFKTNTDIELIQTCNNQYVMCDSCNISSIKYPDFTIIAQDVVMTKRASDFNYTLDSQYTLNLGTYTVTGNCLQNTSREDWYYTFDVNTHGNDLGIGFWILIILLAYGLAIYGAVTEQYVLGTLGGFMMIGLFFYMLNYGLGPVKDEITTIFAWSTFGIAAFVLVKLGINFIQDTYN